MTGKPTFEVPPQMREAAVKSVEQARQAFDGFMSAALKAAETLGKAQDTAQGGAREMGREALAYAEKNVDAALEFAEKVVNARDPQEILKIQAEFTKTQLAAFGEQAKALGTTATKLAKDVADEAGKAKR